MTERRCWVCGNRRRLRRVASLGTRVFYVCWRRLCREVAAEALDIVREITPRLAA